MPIRWRLPLSSRLPARCAAALLMAAPPLVVHGQAADPPADDLPAPAKWEAGVAAGGGRISDYPGADQSHTRGLVAPVFIYRGPVLRVDQGGIRGRVFDRPDLELDLTASAAFNVRDNTARAGMPELDWLFGIGPQLVYKGWRGSFGSPSLHLKLRAVMSTDFRRIDGRGVTFDPELRWRWRPPAVAPAALSLSLQPTWASRALHDYFYEVEPVHATPARPAYDARAGYLGTTVALNLSRRHGRSVLWFASVRAMSLHGSANAASPLLRDTSNVSVGAGIVWTPWQSAARAGN